MLRKLAIALLATAAGTGTAAGAADRELHWRELEVAARLDAEGALHVQERQAMVLTGAWNGGERRFDLRPGQRLRFERLSRVGPDGRVEPLAQGALSAVDHWDFTDGETLRWRSRLPEDPEFQETELDYLLEYTLEHVLVERGGGRFELDHDFAFPDWSGPILSVRARLELDPAWQADRGSPITAAGGPLQPGQSAVLAVPLRWVGAGEPPSRALRPSAARGLVAGLAAVLAAAAALVLWRLRAVGQLAPLTPADRIDGGWLRDHVFTVLPEVAGLAWHGKVGAPEVGALLARMEREGKLSSRTVPGAHGTAPVVQLQRLVPERELRGRERELAEALFFDGDRTDSLRVRRHYRSRGFDPAAKIEHDVRMDLQEAAPEPKGRSWRAAWIGALVLAAAAVAVGVAAADQGEPAGVLVGSLVGWVLLSPLAAFAAHWLRTRMSRQAVAAAVAAALPLGWALLLARAIMGASGDPGGPGALPLTALSLALGCAATAVLLALVAVPRTSPERVELRKRLAAARAFFAAELGSPRPRLDDAWAPYLVALGLGAEAGRWARIDGPAAPSAAGVGREREPLAAAGQGSPAQAASRWTGGGGMFSGGGASGSWAAIGDLSSPVSAPSSSSGSSSSSSDGFSSSSSSSSSSGGGGGGGGGW